ncbi:Alpha-1:6-mannosyl-glycoprotein 2-beta-N-acetylglucosaminyltransferase-like protein [Leptotrombidium deliense]|uniref:Alpha-1,6-mannosyl-glycoprotein 2-beta-N-acetylglucosaminyltransferase n=1 Tax=Leptotrombidium deliense TaxID=299467 RepID=A0A443SAQ2_9ACAR|nr:Alpha-1:6-mannosyl-glycoprotein 2-beta-N-acetylglucosaminyltransferase-like protein [Leptotrombidium deliense]
MRFLFYLRIKSFIKLFPVIIFFYSLCYVWLQFNDKHLPNGENEPQNYDLVEETSTSVYDVNFIKESIEIKNREQIILNSDKFGSLRANDTIIVIQVHNRIQYLTFLIESLKLTVGIEKALLIFSHDVFDLRLNNLIESIDFCKVLQIFYPYSLQVFTNTFPGPDVKDCPRNIDKQQALLMKCINAEFPDTYGHYREARYTQTKHHWFWKINHIFDYLNVTNGHTGFILFLEEDHYAAPDMLHVLHLMISNKLMLCETCDVFTLGSYTKSFNYALNANKVEIQKWSSSKHNMGFAFNRNSWNKVKSCAKKFCEYDDYNWDWSLQHISLKCLKTPLVTVAVIAPRVFHIGECGVHHKGKNCGNNKLVLKVKRTLSVSRNYLFPSSLTQQKVSKRVYKMSKVNGGWSDKRDHQFCFKHVKQVTRSVPH